MWGHEESYIQVIGRFIHQQDFDIRNQCTRNGHTHAPASRQPRRGLVHCSLAKAEARQDSPGVAVQSVRIKHRELSLNVSQLLGDLFLVGFATARARFLERDGGSVFLLPLHKSAIGHLSAHPRRLRGEKLGDTELFSRRQSAELQQSQPALVRPLLTGNVEDSLLLTEQNNISRSCHDGLHRCSFIPDIFLFHKEYTETLWPPRNALQCQSH